MAPRIPGESPTQPTLTITVCVPIRGQSRYLCLYWGKWSPLGTSSCYKCETETEKKKSTVKQARICLHRRQTTKGNADPTQKKLIHLWPNRNSDFRNSPGNPGVSPSCKWPDVTCEDGCYFLDQENPTKSCKSRGSNLRVHFENAQDPVWAVKGTISEEPPSI